MLRIQPLAIVLVLAVFLIPASCNQEQNHLALTLDGKPYASAGQAAGLSDITNGTEIQIAMCVHPSEGALAAIDDEYCLSFVVASDFSDSLVTPASLRVVGKAAVVDPDPGVPHDYWPDFFVFVGDNGHAPEIRNAYMEHIQTGATWDGSQEQQLDGIIQLEQASKTECKGRVDIDIVGAFPPVTLDVVVHAHVSGSFTARLSGQ